MNDTNVKELLRCFQSEYMTLYQEIDISHTLHQRIKNLSQRILDLQNQVDLNDQQNFIFKQEVDQLNSKIQLLKLPFKKSQASTSSSSSSSASYTPFAHKIYESVKELANGIFQIPCMNQYNLNKGKVTCGFHSLKNALCALAIFKGYRLNSQLFPFYDYVIYKHVERLVMKFSRTSNLSDTTEVQLREAWNAIVSGEESPFPGAEIPLQLNLEDLSIIYVTNKNVVCSDSVSVCDLVKLKKFINQDGPCAHAMIIGSEEHWVSILCEKNDRNDLSWYCMDSSSNVTESLIETVRSIQELIDHFEAIAPKLYFESIGETIERRCVLIGPDHQLIDDSEENRSLFISQNSTLLPLLCMATEFFSNMGWVEDYESKPVRIFIESVMTILDFYRAQGICELALEQMESKLVSAYVPERRRMSQEERYLAQLEMKYGTAANELLKLKKAMFDTINAELILKFVMSFTQERQNDVLQRIISIINDCGYEYVEVVIDLNRPGLTLDNMTLIRDLYDLNLLDMFEGRRVDSSLLEAPPGLKKNQLATLFRNHFYGNAFEYAIKIEEKVKNSPQIAMSILNYEVLFEMNSIFQFLEPLAFGVLCDELNQNLTTGRNNHVNVFMQNYMSTQYFIFSVNSDNRVLVTMKDFLPSAYEEPIYSKFFNSLKSNMDIEIDSTFVDNFHLFPQFLNRYDLWGNVKTLVIEKFKHLEALDGRLELLSNLNSLELQLDYIPSVLMNAIIKLNHLNELTLWNLVQCISLEELRNVKRLIIEDGGGWIYALPCNIEFLKIGGDVDINFEKIFLNPLPHLKEILLTGSPNISFIDWFPDSVKKLSLCSNSNLERIGSFPHDLEFLSIVGCPVEKLPMIPLSVIEVHLEHCRELRKIPNIPYNIREFTISKCDELNEKSKLTVITALIERNFEIVKEIIWDLKIEDFSILEPLIASKALLYYLENIKHFKPPNEKFRLKILKSIIENDNDSRTALAYAPTLVIQNKQKLNTLMMKIDEIKEFVQKHPNFDPNLVDLSFIWTLYHGIENQDEDILLGLLKLSNAVEEFSHVKDLPIVRDFIMKHILSIYANRKALKSLEKIYSPDNEENIEMYPFNAYVKKELLCIDMRIQYAYHHPIECLNALGTLLSIKDINCNQLRVHFYGHQGYDIGGLGRQFIYSLFEGLVHSSSGIRFIFRENGKCVPAITSVTSISEDEINTFESLGRLFAFLISSSKSYPIGEIFDLAFFDIILNIMSTTCIDMSSSEYLEHLNQLPNALMFWGYLVDDEDLRKMEEINHAVMVDQLSPECLDYFKSLLFVDEIDGLEFDNLKQDFFLEIKSIYFKAFVAIHAVAKGLLKSMPIYMNYYEHSHPILTPKQFNIDISKRLQGAISKEEFKNAIKIGPKGIENKDTIKNWMNEWIDRAELKDVRLLLIQLTGSPAISSRIKISLYEEEEFRYETCFNRMYVPESIEKEQLFEELDNVVMEIKNSPLGSLEAGYNVN